MSPIADVEGLSPHEIVALVVVAESTFSASDTVPDWSVRQDIEKAGLTRIAATLACRSLVKKGLIDFVEKTDRAWIGFLIIKTNSSFGPLQ